MPSHNTTALSRSLPMAVPAAEVEAADRCHHGRPIDQDCDLCESEERARENAGCGRLVLWGA